jgi:hypothetical protein
MDAGDKLAIGISVLALVVSAVSAWEAEGQREIALRSEAAANKIAQLINRPWVTLDRVLLQGGPKTTTGIEFRFKNGGPIAALDFEVTPGVTWDDKESLPEELEGAEKDDSMAIGTLPSGEFRSVIMPSQLLLGIVPAMHNNRMIRFAISWRYKDAEGRIHACRQFGHWDQYSQAFTFGFRSPRVIRVCGEQKANMATTQRSQRVGAFIVDLLKRLGR